MEIEQTSGQGFSRSPISVVRLAGAASLAWLRRMSAIHVGYAVFRSVFLCAVLFLLGASALPASQARFASFGLAVSGQSFDLVRWEAGAIEDKVRALVRQPAAGMTDAAEVALVRQYLARAARIGAIERELTWGASAETPPLRDTRMHMERARMSAAMRQGQLEVLRGQQEQFRPAVEQVIERQVGQGLLAAGFGVNGAIWPPVQFTFTEPPKKLVVSGRDRISTVYSRMLVAGLGLDDIQAAEAEIGLQQNAVGYITDVGGLGAYPSMVIDRAGLRWILSTVAHEWVHNYLTFFPLGLNYFASQDMTTLNENVAEIVGNEIGDWLYVHVYGGEIPSSTALTAAGEDDAPSFDFRSEMRATRLEVDRLLAEGDVDGAEAYMDARRVVFVENGYSIRVLNQAYFAFHGSYGTSPASTSPIGPDMERLRELLPDLVTFMHTVRWFTAVEDLEQALASLEQ
jgi:hypothetical protein